MIDKNGAEGPDTSSIDPQVALSKCSTLSNPKSWILEAENHELK